MDLPREPGPAAGTPSQPPATRPRPSIPGPIREGRVIAVARHIDPDAAPGVGRALVAGGVRAMEVTLNEPQGDALRGIRALARVADDLGALVGAGTVLSVDAASLAVDAGARFIVMPHADPAIVGWCLARGVPCFPGALTPTEILAAWQAGAAAVKLFPAASVGVAYLGLLRGPFPDIPLVPTGGVSADTAGEWVAAGAAAVGMGGWLVGDGEPAGIAARARRVREAIDHGLGAAHP
jgi:2-dehydro-3-deoxyphosphogluconate aldolase/(4S)-4-hydroxy-2-oxoglutarate aldolase